MKLPYVYTPGPSKVRENVRMATAREATNPDLDLNFFEYYKETCNKIAKLFHTKNMVRILCGEGILGLEAACASLTEQGDRVLVIDNGIFGAGFADFITMYGGEAVLYSAPREKFIDVEELKKFLEKDSNFKYATVVHCDTPSGVLNDVGSICSLLKKKGILTVVDSVSSIAGEPMYVDEWGIDIALGASQKCISAPTGLTFLSISNEALKIMKERKTPIVGYYCNLLLWEDYYEKKWFPYTMPINHIFGLDAAINNVYEEGLENFAKRHKYMGEAVRYAIEASGLELYIKEGYSNTVTVFKVPQGINEKDLKDYMLKKYDLLIAGSFGYLEGKVLRIGHMGENANRHKLVFVLHVIEESLKHFGFNLKNSLVEGFSNYLSHDYPF